MYWYILFYTLKNNKISEKIAKKSSENLNIFIQKFSVS